MNDLKAQLSNIDSTSFSSLVLIETGPTFFGMIIASRYLKQQESQMFIYFEVMQFECKFNKILIGLFCSMKQLTVGC